MPEREHAQALTGPSKSERIGRLGARWRRWRPADSVSLCRDLAELLEAGLPLREAIACLQTPGGQRGRVFALQVAREAVERGELLSDAWRSWAPTDLTMMLEVGAQSGRLAECLRLWSEQTGKRREWQAAMVRSAAYPALLMVMTLVLQLFILRMILPSMTNMYQMAGASAPESYRLANQFLHLMPVCFLFVLAGFVAAVGAVWWLDRRAHNPLQRWIHRTSLGRWFRLQRTATFASMTAQLVSAGVPILDALSVLQQQGKPRWLAVACKTLRVELLAGNNLASALTGAWDPILSSLMSLTETTGNLSSGLERAAVLLRARWVRQMEAVMRILEPVLVSVSGGLVAVTMLALLLPMYDLMGAMSSPVLAP
ncbi:type II secretion system F family protein [Alicyclobacillus kakegawensis]|uniref:type II secretion system F family protein n=1 Tax=Alicyclobacillus kakegawensis TaxID=392012 RepID=UPI0008353A7F|nr:type II secretion system F family protein [Alicyclobacillus kakegawensis]